MGVVSGGCHHPSMPIGREYARSLFVDLPKSAAVPLDPDELLHMPGLRRHGHVFFGDVAVRCYKHKARWTYDERDIRAAGGTLVELDLDRDDVVDVQLPPYRDMPERDPEEWQRPNWRRQLVSWMFDRARYKLFREERPYEEWGDWQTIGANGLPGGLSWEEFAASSSKYPHLRNIAGTRPLQLLTWPGENWRLPRAYADLLDRWERREEELVARARLCSSCGEQGPALGRLADSDQGGLRHPVPTMLTGGLPAVQRSPSRRAVREAPSARLAGGRPLVPVVQGEPGVGMGTLPRARLRKGPAVRQLQFQRRVAPPALLPRTRRRNPPPPGVPRLPRRADPAVPVQPVRGPRAPDADRTARPVPQAALRPRGGADGRCAPLPSGFCVKSSRVASSCCDPAGAPSRQLLGVT